MLQATKRRECPQGSIDRTLEKKKKRISEKKKKNIIKRGIYFHVELMSEDVVFGFGTESSQTLKHTRVGRNNSQQQPILVLGFLDVSKLLLSAVVNLQC
jgi:hypothetical protein